MENKGEQVKSGQLDDEVKTVNSEEVVKSKEKEKEEKEEKLNEPVDEGFGDFGNFDDN